MDKSTKQKRVIKRMRNKKNTYYKVVVLFRKKLLNKTLRTYKVTL